MFKKIVVPVDLSDRHQKTVETALELARPGEAAITLLHVIELIPGLSLEGDRTFYNRLEETAKAHLSRLAGPLKDRAEPAAEVVVYGKRAETVAIFCAEIGADLVVLTSHVANRDVLPAKWGTMSYKICTLVPCAVLMVK